MDDPSFLPPSLLSRLRSDSLSFSSDLSLPSLSPALSSGRTFLSRKLLSLLPSALSTLERSLSASSPPKEQLAAAKLVLDSSPLASPSPSSLSIPPALLSSLLSSLASFASAFSSPLPPPERTVSEDPPSPLPLEVPMLSSPLPLLNLPSPSPSSEMTSSGLKPKPKSSSPKKKPLPKKKKGPSP